MEGYLIYNSEQEAQQKIGELEAIFLPAGKITNRYGDVQVSNNPEYQGNRFAVRIIELVYNSLSEQEKGSLVTSLPNNFYEINEII